MKNGAKIIIVKKKKIVINSGYCIEILSLFVEPSSLQTTHKDILDEFNDANGPQMDDIMPHVGRLSPHWRFFLADTVLRLSHVNIIPPMDWNCMGMFPIVNS